MSEFAEEKRLCGGIFYDLMLLARRQRTRKKSRFDGISDGLSDVNCFTQMVKCFYPEFKEPKVNTYAQHISAYKKCEKSTGSYFHFNNATAVNAFDAKVKTDYVYAINRMSKLLEYIVDFGAYGEFLVKALLEVISDDSSILDDDVFYAGKEGEAITKKELLNANELCYQNFMLGVFHFVLTKRQDNTVGKDTFSSLYRSENPGAPYEYVGNIGESYKNITLTVYDYVESEENQKTEIYHLIDNEKYSDYFERATDRYATLKTLLYADHPRPFYDFYVENNIRSKSMKQNGEPTPFRRLIVGANVEKLTSRFHYFIICGTGGLGKSMMMRHLFLDAINNYDELHYIPVFIPLKDYDDTYETLFDYVYAKFASIGADIKDEQLKAELIAGNVLLLFDGFDELNSAYISKFEQDMEYFSNRYRRNIFVMSSRPNDSFVSFNRFTVLELLPFTKEQGLELIDKLDFRPDEPDIRLKFRKELDNYLYYSHREFTENPLLLTIMLMTYEQFAEVPSKMHIFYHEAYMALAQKHDASKGAYKRTLKTGLSADRFADYFAEFCARTYHDQKYELTYEEMERYFGALKERERFANEYTITASDFIHDLVANMCLMFYEGGSYHFTHRSFQEFFCALFFSKQKDRTLKGIGDFFEMKRRAFGDKTFSMLYDMIPDKVDEYIILPYLEDFYSKYTSPTGYRDFLLRMYGYLYYEDGNTEDVPFSNRPNSYLFNFIALKNGFKQDVSELEHPFYEDFVDDEYVYIVEKDDSDNDEPPYDGIVKKSMLDDEKISRLEVIDTTGYMMSIDLDHLYSNVEDYPDLIEFIEKDDYPLRIEFERAIKYYKDLKKKIESSGPDLFDMF